MMLVRRRQQGVGVWIVWVRVSGVPSRPFLAMTMPDDSCVSMIHVCHSGYASIQQFLYLHTHSLTHSHTHTHTHTHSHTHTHAHTHVLRVCMCVCVWMCVCVCEWVSECVCVCKYCNGWPAVTISYVCMYISLYIYIIWKAALWRDLFSPEKLTSCASSTGKRRCTGRLWMRCSPPRTYAGVCWRMLTHAHVCSRMRWMCCRPPRT
jgi:hypothetical protein